MSDMVKKGAEVFFVLSSNISVDSYHIEKVSVNLLKTNAISTGRYIARSVENGISLFIDNYGRILSRVEHEDNYMTCNVKLTSKHTFYAKNYKIINLAYIIILCLGLLAIYVLDKRKN